MTKEELAALPEKIRIATEAGTAVAQACPDDGGSANLDHVVIPMPGMRAATLEKYGLPGNLWEPSTYHPRGLHLPANFGGIGHRNYAGVQAMHQSLKAQGVDCYVYYQMD
ncbi:hypothetical protein [Pseudomonas typographi]|uniref:hypothetical protein n=1 Tax=Pseudomonas typographi TaxID=2715964 RepID=UPI0016831FFE|nr:hypothetical protein [Pseudomonas typographi]MBD1554252.1 hypothetical protein [Pseudomonas typographi]